MTDLESGGMLLCNHLNDHLWINQNMKVFSNYVLFVVSTCKQDGYAETGEELVTGASVLYLF